MGAAHIDASDTDWEDVYRSVGPRLQRQLEGLVGPDAAADLLHDCFVRAMRSANVPADADERRFWLYRVATNLAVDQLRRGQRWARVRSLLPIPEQPAPEEERDLVRAALGQIPPEQAVALVLRLVEGMKPREIALVQGASESAMKSRLARGRLNFIAAYRRLERP